MSQFSPAIPILSQSSSVMRPLVSYVHSGNTVIQPTSLDFVTGIWTVSTGNLTQMIGPVGTSKSVVPVARVWENNIIPREIRSADAFKLEVVSDTEMYLLAGLGSPVRISSYPHTSNTSVNVSKFFFEANSPTSVSLDISSFRLTELYTRVFGNRERSSQTYVNVTGASDGVQIPQSQVAVLDGKGFHTIFAESYCRYDVTTGMFFRQGVRSFQTYWNESTGTWIASGSSDGNSRMLVKYPNLSFETVRINFLIGNGFTMEVYDLNRE